MISTYTKKSAQQTKLKGAHLKPVSVRKVNYVMSIPQPKFKTGQPNDKYEQEADRKAERIMRMPEQQLSTSANNSLPVNNIVSSNERIQHACLTCSDNYELLHKKTSGKTPKITSAINTGLQSLQGGGHPLSRSERSFFEPRFGENFSNVRVHTGLHAAAVARSINARAFTFRNNIVFDNGEYSVNSLKGKKLFAHELTHVVQQSKSSPGFIQRQEHPSAASILPEVAIPRLYPLLPESEEERSERELSLFLRNPALGRPYARRQLSLDDLIETGVNRLLRGMPQVIRDLAITGVRKGVGALVEQAVDATGIQGQERRAMIKALEALRQQRF